MMELELSEKDRLTDECSSEDFMPLRVRIYADYEEQPFAVMLGAVDAWNEHQAVERIKDRIKQRSAAETYSIRIEHTRSRRQRGVDVDTKMTDAALFDMLGYELHRGIQALREDKS